jgi:hypothetical protein
MSYICNLFGHRIADDRLCDLVARVPGYRSRGPGWIPGATRFSENQWVGLVSTIEELLERKSSGSGLEIEITAVGDPPR